MYRLEKILERVQEKKRFSIVKGFLYAISRCYQLAVASRHLLYHLSFKKIIKAPIPIISVGNLVCGGSGKSEFVSKIMSDLGNESIAILSRGYRSKRRGKSRVVRDIDDGDEPFMLQERFRENSVIVGKKREQSAALAKEVGAKAAILDDGMQYIKLKKDLHIVLLRADNPLGESFIPLGKRRELYSKLADADYTIIHGEICEEKYELAKRSILCYSSSKCFGTRYCLKKNEKLIGKRVGVFCGIGNPQAFMRGLSKLKLEIVKKKFLADHEKFTNILDFYHECKNANTELIVCTYKDYVKLADNEKKLVTPIDVSMEISYDSQIYDELICEINSLIC